jgi:hypothetical protein
VIHPNGCSSAMIENSTSAMVIARPEVINTWALALLVPKRKLKPIVMMPAPISATHRALAAFQEQPALLAALRGGTRNMFYIGMAGNLLRIVGGFPRRDAQRLQRVRPDAEPAWGTLNAPRMLCHLADQMRVALGDLRTEPVHTFASRRLLKLLVINTGLEPPRGKIQTAPRCACASTLRWFHPWPSWMI